jgi:autotransporter strand-loop-strand O-heptosyltransferase
MNFTSTSAEFTVPAVLEAVAPTVSSSEASPAEAAVTSSAQAAVGIKPAYPRPAQVPTEEGPRGLRFDFNDGCRVVLPQAEHPWRVRLSDIDTGNILFETELKGGHVNSTKRYYVRIRLEVWQQNEIVLVHDYSAADREILVQLPVGTLGDPLGWFPYAAKFQEKHGCKLTCGMGDTISELFRKTYPNVTFQNHEEIKTDRFYATYSLGLFFDDKDFVFQPTDFRHVGLHRTAGYILGVDPIELAPRVHVPDDSRPIVEPYVCIGAQSTTQSKYWNNPTGWRELVAFLKDAGYRVICIDQKTTHGTGLIWNHIPYDAEDQTGDKPLIERARYLKHAEFFVGLSSGLSWLAWAMGTPVVMISGFTLPTNEFDTPYRVINYHACNGCWNDVREKFDHKDFLWCPRHKDTPRQFECTRLITADQVKSVIRTIPGFGAHTAASTSERTGRKAR